MYPDILEYGIPTLIFVLVASGFYSLIARQLEDRRTRLRLRDEVAQPGDLLLQRQMLLGELTPALAAQMPVAPSDQDDVLKELKTAGYYGASAILEYAAVRTVLVLVPLIATGLLALMVDQEQMVRILIGGGIVSALGYSLPRIYVHLKGKERLRKLENALPVAVDMLTLCITGGQTLQAALARVSKELSPAHPLMAAELAITRRHAELSNLPHALRQLADRIPVGEIRNLAIILAQAERLGSETGAALIEYTNNLRTTIKQRADGRANQAMFWMLFPTLICLWIPAAILLVGPAILEFRAQRQTIFKEWRESRNKLRDLNKPTTTQPQSPGDLVQATNSVPDRE